MKFQELKEIARKAGIVGAGGAGFPLHAKLNTKSEHIIINGAECEPLLTADRQLMEQYAVEIVETLATLVKAVGAKTGIIAFKNQYKKAHAALKEASALYDNIILHPLPNTYPVGDEVTLIYECTGLVVPRGALPIEKGITSMNVETLFNLGKAINQDLPVTHTYVTIGGDVPRPMTLRIPIGMKIDQIIPLTGRENIDHHEIIMGGPMTGEIVSSNDVVVKTSNALLVLERDHYVVTRKQAIDYNSLRRIMSSCSNCRRCTDLCPRNILGHKVEPHKLMLAVANGLVEHSAISETSLGCCGCNLCSLYSCHHDLAPAELMMKIKGELTKNKVRPKEQKETQIDDWKEYRQVPTSRLTRKLGLTKYDVDAPLNEMMIDPKYVEIPLKQHIGASAIPNVALGDLVIKGQLIAYIKEDALGAPIHASINGTITKVDQTIIRIERGV